MTRTQFIPAAVVAVLLILLNNGRYTGVDGLVFKDRNGVPSWTYYLLASTNLGLPTARWMVVAANNINVAAVSFSPARPLQTRLKMFTC